MELIKKMFPTILRILQYYFHKPGKKYNIHSPQPTLKRNNHDIERVNTTT